LAILVGLHPSVSALYSSIQPVSARLLSRARTRLGEDARARYLAVSALFSGLVVVFTWPLVLHFNSAVLGAPGDVPNGLRVWWSLSAQHGDPFTSARDHFINAPEGVPVNRAVYLANGLFQGFWWFGGQLIGWAAAYNLFDLIAFAGAGVAAFILFDRLELGVLPALFGAYVFTFNPNHVEKVYSSAPLAATAVLPLLLLALFAKRRSPSRKNALLVGAALLAAFYLNTYIGLFAIWTAGVFALVELAIPPMGARRLDLVRSYYFTALVLVFGLAPAAWSWATNASTVEALAATRTTSLHGGFGSLQLYLLPGPRNPWFGGPMRNWLHGHLAWEGTMFIGYTTIALALLGLVVAIIRRRAGALSRDAAVYVTFAFALVVTGLWASLPPNLHLAGLHVLVPQEILARQTTLFRVFARFGVLVGLGTIMLAVFALANVPRVALARVLPIAALVLVAVELWVPLPRVTSVPNDPVGITVPQIGSSLSGTPVLLSLEHPPAYVTWLAAHPGGVVADYPSPAAPDGRWEWKHAYYQTIHHHPLWQTTSTSDAKQDVHEFRASAADLANPLAPILIRSADVRYVVAHLNEYRARKEPLPHPNENCGLSAVAHFPKAVIYRVTAPARGWVARGKGFYSIANAKLWPENIGYAWMGATAQLTVFWPTADTVTIQGPAVSLNVPRRLSVRDGKGAVVGGWEIGPSETSFSIPVQVHAGFNFFTFTVSPGPRVRGFGDTRHVSIAMPTIGLLTATSVNRPNTPLTASCGR